MEDMLYEYSALAQQSETSAYQYWDEEHVVFLLSARVDVTIL